MSEVSTSEDDLDSSGGDSDDEDEEQDNNEGPTLVTVDDGKGGVKHIKVSLWQLQEIDDMWNEPKFTLLGFSWTILVGEKL